MSNAPISSANSASHGANVLLQEQLYNARADFDYWPTEATQRAYMACQDAVRIAPTARFDKPPTVRPVAAAALNYGADALMAPWHLGPMAWRGGPNGSSSQAEAPCPNPDGPASRWNRLKDDERSLLSAQFELLRRARTLTRMEAAEGLAPQRACDALADAAGILTANGLVTPIKLPQPSTPEASTFAESTEASSSAGSTEGSSVSGFQEG